MKSPSEVWDRAGVKQKISGYDDSGMGGPSGYTEFRALYYDGASESDQARIRDAITELVVDKNEQPFVRIAAAHVAAAIGMEAAARYLDELEKEVEHPGLRGILWVARALYIEKRPLRELLQ